LAASVGSSIDQLIHRAYLTDWSNAVDDFVAAEALNFNKDQQASMGTAQRVQYQSLAINQIQQVSIVA